MRQQIVPTGDTTWPARPCRVLVEDPALDLDALRGVAATNGIDVVACTGPRSPAEPCPLVLDGACPAGRPDVVVCALGPEWRPSVEAAWRQTGVPVVSVADGQLLPWPAHVGAALQATVASGSFGDGGA